MLFTLLAAAAAFSCADPNTAAGDLAIRRGERPCATGEMPAPLPPPGHRPVTPAEQRRVKAAFDKLLKDGPSARWDFKFARKDVIVCGEVNAKNSFGAYDGWQPFTFDLESGAASTYDDDRLWLYKTFCFNVRPGD